MCEERHFCTRTEYYSIHQLMSFCRVSLVQLVRFLVVKLTHLDLNYRFDMSVVFTTNYSFS
jgi:hypothetical protein